MSRRAILSTLVVAALSMAPPFAGGPPTAAAADRGVGLGIVVGEPTGLSGKFWLGGRTALDAALAWSTFDDRDNAVLQLDYVWHDFGLLSVERGVLPVYYGIGGRLALNERDNRLGVRVPLGLAYLFPCRRADLFLEVAPTLDLSPDTNLDVTAGLGVRYFFR